MSGVVDLEEKSILGANEDPLDLGTLLEWVGIIIEVLEV